MYIEDIKRKEGVKKTKVSKNVTLYEKEENIFNSEAESDEGELSDEEALMQLRKMMGR